MKRVELRRIAYREAAALLDADMSGADLQCAADLSEDDEDYVREYIRDHIVALLESKATSKPKAPKNWPKRWKPIPGAM